MSGTETTCGAGPVQYEGAIAGSKKAEFPKCEACKKELETGSYWRDGKPYCSDCFTMMLAEHNPEKDLPNSDYGEKSVDEELPFQYEEPMSHGKHVMNHVSAHWEYTKGALEACGVPAEKIELARYFYVTSGVHFYGHGSEYANKEATK
jgi:hypothetical protein